MSQPERLKNVIRLRGVEQNNLKNLDLDLPAGRLIVMTGPSGSGKSSLAFDVLYAEGRRRYVETFSPYARQFFDRMEKPRARSIEGIPPAIAIEQRNAVRSTRSTVGTMTEICDYAKALWPHLAKLRCRQCDRLVAKDSPASIWKSISGSAAHRDTGSSEVLIAFEIPLSDKLSWAESRSLLGKQGYRRFVVPSNDRAGADCWTILELEKTSAPVNGAQTLCVLQDRARLSATNRARFVESCEQAFHFGRGQLQILFPDEPSPRRFSNQLRCASCGLDYREAAPALFSFNHPVGACPTCRGFGRTTAIDYNLAIPDRSLSLAAGAVRPWRTGSSAESQDDLMKFCKKRSVPTDVPFNKLSAEHQEWVFSGDPGYGADKEHRWPKAWYGVRGYFRWLESRAYKMHCRVLLARYRSYENCPDCHGSRLRPEALLYKLELPDGRRFSLPDFYALTVSEASTLLNALALPAAPGPAARDPLRLALGEVAARVGYLEAIGLGYLTLDRATRTLSGGETERVNLTSCLGSGLVQTLFILDEPSVGLHPRDTDRLVTLLERLRDAGNTVVVVEHESNLIRAADYVIDLGPGQGETGGEIVFQGTCAQLMRSARSLTGQYLSGRKRIPLRAPKPPPEPGAWIRISNATLHNVKNLTTEFPLGRFVCLTGVSGSGKTTLARDLLLPALQTAIRRSGAMEPAAAISETGREMDEKTDENIETPSFAGSAADVVVTGAENLGGVLMVDQSSIGRTPRSNPVVYAGAFDSIRDLFAGSPEARRAGMKAGVFSFNSKEGQCELCRGAGFEKIEMQFLSDVFVTCPACHGRRYREHVLEVRLPSQAPPSQPGESQAKGKKRNRETPPASGWNIADLLEATIDQGIEFLRRFEEERPARAAISKMEILRQVGLGYLRLGQPVNTLSGGESQRLKLVRHLAEFAGRERSSAKPSLFLFDEPTTGLHFQDVAVLLKCFQQMVDEGHTVVVIEHNMDLIAAADWIIDLGPEAGAGGGAVVVAGPPDRVRACPASHTGRALEALRLKR